MNRFYLRRADTQEIWGRSRAPPGPQTRGPPPGRGSRWEREVGGALPGPVTSRTCLACWRSRRPCGGQLGARCCSTPCFQKWAGCHHSITCTPLRPHVRPSASRPSLPDARLLSVPLLSVELCPPKSLRGGPNLSTQECDCIWGSGL